MQVGLFGLSHDVAPIAIRERVAFVGREVPEALADFLDAERIAEIAILSTCNRTELYVATGDPPAARQALIRGLAKRCGISRQEVAGRFRWRDGNAAVQHLFRVAAGVESQIIGECQILGQVREASRLARDARTLGPLLDQMFRHAVAVGKRSRHETGISQGAVSIGSAAVELARKALGSLEGLTALVIGAGKLGESALKPLSAKGVKRVLVSNRTLDSATELARLVGGEPIPFTGLEGALREADLVFCCTGAPHFVLSAADFEVVMVSRLGREIVVVDVSVPRNIEPAVGLVPGVKLFDIDQLSEEAQRHHAQRVGLVPQVESIVVDELETWDRFLRSHQAAPTITGLRHKFETLRAAEVELFFSSAGAVLSPALRAEIDALTRSITAKFLHDPTVGLRDRGDGQQGVHAAAIRELFGLTAPPAARVRRSKIGQTP